jgi:hypothetical protein
VGDGVIWDPVGRDRRGAPRYAVDLPAMLRAYRQPAVEARIEDVSTGGALIAAAAPDILRGDEILVDLGWSEFVVTVAWVADAYLGVTFHRPLHPVELDGMRRRGRE